MRGWQHRNVGATLPSAESAAALVRGEPRALPLVAIHYLGRAALIAGGLAIVGSRDHLLRDSLAGSAMIEAFVIFYQLARPS